MNFNTSYLEFSRFSEHLQSISLFFARLVVAYGFYEPAMSKWSDINAVAQWFGELGIPMPLLNAYMAATTETVGVILLALGFLTRLISIPLIAIMVVATFAVHLPNGFLASENGFEIPLYYMLFLLVFLSHGAGRISVDRAFFGGKS